MKNILSLIDFSGLTDEIIQKSIELAGFYKAKCWIVHVAKGDPEFVGYEVGPQYIRDDRAHKLRTEHHRLDELKKRVSDSGVEVESLLIQGSILETIFHEVEKLEIDMVILGSHGHGRLYEIFVGSVCEGVLRNVDVPILIIPDSGRKQKE